MATVVITGSTGMLGSNLVAHYLLNTSHNLVLLMRKKRNDDLHTRVDEIFKFWGLAKALMTRVRIADVNIQMPYLGAQQLSETIPSSETIYFIHALAPLRHDLTQEQARQDILNTTQEALRLATSFKNLKRFSFVSTMEVFGASTGVFYEKPIEKEPRFFNNYEYGKFHAEQLLMNEMKKGVPITIFRPSMIVGHSKTGQITKFFSFYLALEKFILKPDFAIMPPAPAIVTVPVDWASLAIQLLTEAEFGLGEIYNLSQGQDDTTDMSGMRAIVDHMTKRENVQTINGANENSAERNSGTYKFNLPAAPITLPQSLFKVSLQIMSTLTRGHTHRRLENRLRFIDFCGFKPLIDNSKLQTHLQRLGYTWPKFKDYAEPVIRYYMSERQKQKFPF